MPTPIEGFITVLTIFTALLFFSFLINLAFNLKQSKTNRYDKRIKEKNIPTIALKGAIISRKQIKSNKKINR